VLAQKLQMLAKITGRHCDGRNSKSDLQGGADSKVHFAVRSGLNGLIFAPSVSGGEPVV
jgi:hypothetical protein